MKMKLETNIMDIEREASSRAPDGVKNVKLSANYLSIFRDIFQHDNHSHLLFPDLFPEKVEFIRQRQRGGQECPGLIVAVHIEWRLV